MTKQEAYDAVLEQAKAVSPELIQIPYMPVGVYLQEAEDLHNWSLTDKDLLIGAGVLETSLEELDILCGATRQAQSNWSEQKKLNDQAIEQWAEESPRAFDLKDQLIHTFRYAYRKDKRILSRVSEIAEGGGIDDMIQDLSDLEVMGKNNPEPLQQINFDMTLVDKAGLLSDAMADLRAEANGEKRNANEALEIRNQMYTLLKEKVDEIRSCGKYLFWRDAKRLIGYTSEYNRRRSN
ncbi:hypothetical protein E9993_16175 [Labilibacter sediminis]|nr:hypothetical protein E9993_16175 [Labilibacter sediminis]